MDDASCWTQRSGNTDPLNDTEEAINKMEELKDKGENEASVDESL